MYACICMYVYVCMYMYACICMYVYVYMYIYVCVYVCVYMHVCMYVYVCVCIHVYVCMHNILGELCGGGNVLPKTGGGIVPGNCPGGKCPTPSALTCISIESQLYCIVL